MLTVEKSQVNFQDQKNDHLNRSSMWEKVKGIWDIQSEKPSTAI